MSIETYDSYEELERSISVGRGKITGRRKFKIAWSESAAFARDLVGMATVIGTNTMIVTAPDEMPGWAKLWCIEAAVDGFPRDKVTGQGTNLKEIAAYDFAVIDGRYETLPFDPFSGPKEPGKQVYVTERLDFAQEVLSIPKDESGSTGYKFATTGNLVEEQVGKVVGQFAYDFTLHRVPNLPIATLLAYMGRANATAWKGIPAEQALFATASAERTTTADGSDMWQVTYHVLVREQSFNALPNPKTGLWEKVTPARYQTAEFNNLLI